MSPPDGLTFVSDRLLLPVQAYEDPKSRASARPAARLHFAHAETLLPLTSLLGLFGAPGLSPCAASQSAASAADDCEDLCLADWYSQLHLHAPCFPKNEIPLNTTFDTDNWMKKAIRDV